MFISLEYKYIHIIFTLPTLVFTRVWNALTLESQRSESLSLFKKKMLVTIWKNTMFLAVSKTANHAVKVY